MVGVYLSLNQGMTELKRQFKSDAKTALFSRAANFRAMLGSQPGFLQEIDLSRSFPSNDTSFMKSEIFTPSFTQKIGSHLRNN